MESAEHHVRDENLGIWVGVFGVCRVKRCTSIEETHLGKFDSLSDRTPSEPTRITLHDRASVCVFFYHRGFLVPSSNKSE